MDEVDALGNEDAREPPRVESHGEWILARGGKWNMPAADRLHFAREFAGIAGDQRPGARFDQRRRDRERRPLVAARGERRDDLQDGAARERRACGSSERGERVDAHAGRRRAGHARRAPSTTPRT